MQDYIRFVLPDPMHNNYGIECWLNDRERATEFEGLCLKTFAAREFGTFWQGGHDGKEWRYFEFWADPKMQDLILTKCEEVAAHFGLPLVWETPRGNWTATD